MNDLAKVLAGDLENDRVSSLVEFLRATSNGQIVRRRKSIELTDLTRKRIKFLLQKFLHINRMSEYGVLDPAGTFEIVHIKPETKREKRAWKREPLKHPVPYGPPIPYLSGVVKPILRVEWQGKLPPKKATFQEMTPVGFRRGVSRSLSVFPPVASTKSPSASRIMTPIRTLSSVS